MSSSRRREIRQAVARILEQRGCLCTICGDRPVEDEIADAIGEIFARKREKPKTNNELLGLARALAVVCVIDFSSNREKLFAEAKRLAQAEPRPTAEAIRATYGSGGAWYSADWRGKQGQPPTLGQVRLTWAKLAGTVHYSGQPVVIQVGQ